MDNVVVREANVLLLVGIIMVFCFSAAQAQQAPINCKGRLSEEQLSGLLKGGVADLRVQAFVNKCGIAFPLSPDAERRLRAAGASDAVVATVRAHAPKPLPALLGRGGEELARITWVDPKTKLMWARKDNRLEVNWNEAMSYCGQLRLGGFSDWRLPEISELDELYDGSVKQEYMVKGGIQLSGNWAWSATGEGSDFAWSFHIAHGRRYSLNVYSFGGRALCVRGAKAGSSTEPLEDHPKTAPEAQYASEAREKRNKSRTVEEQRARIRHAKVEGQWREAEAGLKVLAALLPEDAEMRSCKSWVAEARALWDSMTLAEGREEIASLEKKVEEVRKTTEAARDVELKQLEERYLADREKAGQVAPKGMFETSVQYEERLARAKASQDDLESRYKAGLEGIEERSAEAIEGQSQGYRKRMEELKARLYVQTRAKAEFVSYDADASRLTAKVNGEEYWFLIGPEAAQTLVCTVEYGQSGAIPGGRTCAEAASV